MFSYALESNCSAFGLVGNPAVYNKYLRAAQKGGIMRFARGTRSHWGIENSLHWVLDMVFDEDRCRIRKGNAPESMSVMRHIALSLFRQDKSTNRSNKGHTTTRVMGNQLPGAGAGNLNAFALSEPPRWRRALALRTAVPD